MARPELKWTTVQEFPGFLDKRDVTQMPPGALIVGSQNVRINDADRVSVRRGSSIFGADSTDTTPITSMHTMKRRDAVNIMMRAYGTVLEYFHPDTETWENLNSGYTAAQKFGFADHNVNTDALDYVYFCNAVEPYSRWTGRFTQLNGALSGGETTITVDSTLTDTVFDDDTASSVTTTTLTISTDRWGTDLWNDFYVLITDGAQAGQISKITATTDTQITFGTITGLSGTPTFEIRQLAFGDPAAAPEKRVLRIGTTDITYTTISTSTTFEGVTNAPVATDDAAVTQAIEEFPVGAPRGNIFLVLNTRMFMAGVKVNPQALYHSAIADALDFGFSSPRAADEGGIIDTPEGGGGIIGMGIQEETIYLLKEDIIKTVTFTQDSLDLPIVKPLIEAPEVGAVNSLSTFKVDTKLYFAAKDGGIKSVGRIKDVDFVQPKQLSDPIVNFVEGLDFTDSAAIFFKQKAYIACKTANSSANDRVIVFNFQKNAWEGVMVGINASSWTIYNGELYFGSSFNPVVFKLEDTTRKDDNGAPYASIARFAFNNYGKPENVKQFQTLFAEGYISQNTTLNIKVMYNYQGLLETKQMSLSGTDSQYILEETSYNALGLFALGLNPLAAVTSNVNAATSNDLPKFRVYFPIPVTPFYELSVEFSSDVAGDDWEILRFSTDAEVKAETNTNLKKSLT